MTSQEPHDAQSSAPSAVAFGWSPHPKYRYVGTFESLRCNVHDSHTGPRFAHAAFCGISQIEPQKNKPTDRNVPWECIRFFPHIHAIRQELLSLANDKPQQTAHGQSLRLSTEHHSLPNEEEPRRRFLTVASGSAIAGLLGAYGTFAYMPGEFVYPAAGKAKGWLLSARSIICLKEKPWTLLLRPARKWSLPGK